MQLKTEIILDAGEKYRKLLQEVSAFNAACSQGQIKDPGEICGDMYDALFSFLRVARSLEEVVDLIVAQRIEEAVARVSQKIGKDSCDLTIDEFNKNVA